MSLYQDLPYSLCESGPKGVEGVGNYYVQVFAHAPARRPLLTLYFLDTHVEIPSEVKNPDYDWIKQSQIDWFTQTSQALRKEREKDSNHGHFHHSLAFMHIPLPEFADSNLVINGGQRREPTEGPSFNSHFYDALAAEGVVAVGCGHDHVNDFCGHLRQRTREESQPDGMKNTDFGPWLCYGGGSGFGGYGSYGGNYCHRRTRVWEFDLNTGAMKTWKRIEYASGRVDELVLVENGSVAAIPDNISKGPSDMVNEDRSM